MKRSRRCEFSDVNNSLESVIRRTLLAKAHLIVHLPSARPSLILHVPTYLRFPYDILC